MCLNGKLFLPLYLHINLSCISFNFHFLLSLFLQTIIFSQFTTMLDLLADYMDLRSIGYGRLDGQMQFSERQTQMAVFQGDPDCWVFLTSTRAGGLGINLTAADTVIIYDSDWVCFTETVVV